MLKSSATGSAPAAAASYPKLLQGDSGSVWLVTGPKAGVIVHLSGRPQKAKHHVGYASGKLVEAKMRPFVGEVRLAS